MKVGDIVLYVGTDNEIWNGKRKHPAIVTGIWNDPSIVNLFVFFDTAPAPVCMTGVKFAGASGHGWIPRPRHQTVPDGVRDWDAADRAEGIAPSYPPELTLDEQPDGYSADVIRANSEDPATE